MQPKQAIEVYNAKDGRSFVIRAPHSGDVEELMNFINELVDEEAPISTNERQTYASEIRYLADEMQKILDGRLIALVATAGDKIVAHAEIRRGSGRSSHVGTLGISVLKEFRNLGLGQELIRLLIKLAKSQGFRLIKLEVFANNMPAIHLYKKLGFVQTGFVPNMYYYKEGYVDALIMCLKL